MKTLFLPILLAACLTPSFAAASKDAYLHFMNGMVLERRGEYDLALQEYKRTLLLDPESVFVYKQALNLALHIGKVEEAWKWAQFIVKADSSTADNWIMYGNVSWARGDIERARTSYEKAVELDPSAYEGFYQLASLWSSKDQVKSVGYLKKYLELRPEDAAEVYYQMAVLYNIRGDAANVEKSLKMSKAADPYYPQPRYMLADFYESKSNAAAALEEYKQLIVLDSRNAELYNHIGELYAGPALSDLDQAEKYFMEAWLIDTTDPTACFWLSVIREQKRDFSAAATFLEGSAALKTDAALVLRLAYYYTQSGGYKKAIAMLEKAAMKWPDNSEIAYFLALGYDDTGKTGKALQMLKGIVQRDPDNKEARMQLGMLSERENDMETAEEQFRYLIRMDPSNANVLNYLGYSLADRGMKLDEAELMITGAVAAEPANGAFLDSLAWVRFKRGNLVGALEGIKKAVELLYDDAVIWGHAGDIQAALGSPAKAWTCWKYSWILEKPEKRSKAASRLKEIEKDLDDKTLEGLEEDYLKAFSPYGREFSSFARLKGKLRGKTMVLDAMVHFSPPSDLNLTVMGPLMAPLWRGRVSEGMADLDAISLKGIDSEAFSYWASLMMVELKDWFAGDYLGAQQNRRGDCFESGSREVCLNGDRSWPEKIVNKTEKKLKMYPGKYFMRDLFLFPGELEFKLPYVMLKIELDRDQMKFGGVNVLKMPE